MVPTTTPVVCESDCGRQRNRRECNQDAVGGVMPHGEPRHEPRQTPCHEKQAISLGISPAECQTGLFPAAVLSPARDIGGPKTTRWPDQQIENDQLTR